ncbi:translation elongation factor 4 [Candidatus Methylacidithermus pantelleriae]|uniref:Elongation factor 4 n=1 Tax=Candidatus Methylacidithermus pantelleriae TaxID=2744239 RepID=A0A8J2BNM5_9BACT|nr:translation elongation factor 4 [Candidatus Methylacidithermus pantelleriae]CAF0705263.1 elongation factor 4 [Candidatus Methylacidithermus pantelleriae]
MSEKDSFHSFGQAVDASRVRNFSIIAHVDHGKTTLSDRLLQRTGTIPQRQMEDQVLDAMDLERERGITIKAHPVTMYYQARDGQTYLLNLIDTPGHVDFSYEVSRSLAACEGALLVVDASQGVQAQTVANVQLALRQNLVVVPVINKIDLPTADVEGVRHQLEEILAIPKEEAILASAKEGIGIDEVLEAIVTRFPPPSVPEDGLLRALIFDSVYDPFRGVVLYVRLFSGRISRGDRILLFSTGRTYEVKEVGIFRPKPVEVDHLVAGFTGYVVANIRSPEEVSVGETVTSAQCPVPEPLPGFRRVLPMVYSGLYPLNPADFEKLKSALFRLKLNDAALQFTQEHSVALGSGFRCGFLGLLHMEIVQERLRREYEVEIVATYPSVVYRIVLTQGKTLEVYSPAFWPDPSQIEEVMEPYVEAILIVPNDCIGDVLQLVLEKRGTCRSMETVDSKRILLRCEIPLAEILVDFHDRLKTITRGYGSMDYEFTGYRPADLVKLDILVNGEPVEAFSCIVAKEKAQARGRALVGKLKDLIPPHLFKVAIQAAVGGKILAREDVRALAKNVTAKCYGGDITRKRKLWEKQKEGKKRMRAFGRVNIPQEAFLEVLKVDVET